MSDARIQSYLSGRWQDGTGPGAALVNPTTEAVIAHADTSGLDMGAALSFAREAGTRLRELTFGERGELLQKVADASQAAREALIESAIENGGCTRGDAKFDVDGAIGTLAAYARLAQELGDKKVLADGEGIQLGRSPRFWGQHIYTPKTGVAVFINAFNFPAWGFGEKAACAILAGMPVLTKPATATSHTAHLLIEKIIEANVLPEGALSFVGGGAQDLLDHMGPQDVLAFTGSAWTGLKLKGHDAIMKNSVPVNIEADSLNAAVLGPDVELGSDAWQLFLRDVTNDMTQKTGQKCTAIRRIMVPEARVDDVIEAMSERLSDIKIGNPTLREVRMGPVATKSQLRDVADGVKKLREECDVVYGDPDAPVDPVGAEKGKGFFFPITLLKSKDGATSKVVHEHEVFGPCSTIVPYSGSAEDAVELVSRGQGSLVSSVFSDDRSFVTDVTIGIAPYNGRLYLGSAKVLDHTMGPGTVLPMCVHGGPGRAGGGEELGGVRGVKHFMQRTAIQGYRAMIEKISGTKA